MIRVALVDDQTIVRTGLARILSPTDGFEIVAECGDGAELLAIAPELDADVVLMDVRMPQLDGIEATRRLRAIDDAPPVLILTTFDEDELLWGAIEAGASGFVLKDTTADELIAGVTAVAGGGAGSIPPWRRGYSLPTAAGSPRASDRLGGSISSPPASTTCCSCFHAGTPIQKSLQPCISARQQ